MTATHRMEWGELIPLTPEEIAAQTPTLEARKAALRDEVGRLRDEYLLGGYSHAFGAEGVHVLQTRGPDDKINWLTSQAAYAAAVAGGHGSVAGASFRSAENATFTVTYTEGLNALLGMAAWGSAIYGRSWALKDEIAAASDEAALDAIDVETGWAQ